jgi:hypothetical protein
MSKKERPKIYQHTSGGGHELIHNNPSPLVALQDLGNWYGREIDLEYQSKVNPNKSLEIIHTALTNYANMVEMLEGLVEKYELSTKKIHEVGGFVSMDIIQFITDITKVLEVKV